MSLHIFNYSVKKLLNLEWSLSIIYSSWKNKTPRISSEILWMVINLSNNFLQNPLFFIVWNQKQILFILRKIGSREIKLLNFKRSSKRFPRIQKPYQVPYIFCNTLSSASIQPFYASRLPPTETVGLQWICRAQLFIDTTHLPFWLPWNYVTSPLTYSRGQLRINRGITVLRCC